MFRVILGMADEKKEIERSLTSVTWKLIDHLFKLYRMFDFESANHWKGEVYGFISQVPKLRNTKKFPKATQIYSWTYGKYQDVIEIPRIKILISNLKSKYGFDPTDLDISVITKDFDSFCDDYFRWLSSELGTYGAVSFEDTCSKIDQLVQFYAIKLKR